MSIRVLQVFGALDLGGAEARMMDVYRCVDTQRYEFTFLSLSTEKQFFEPEIISRGGKVVKIKSPREIGLRKHFHQLRDCIRKGQYQVVHAHTSYHCGLVMLAAWMEHVPVRISHARTTGTKQNSVFKSTFLHLGRTLIQLFSTDRIAISQEAGNYLFGKKDFIVIPNAINVLSYQCPDPNRIAILKKELGIGNESFVIGQIGRFDSMKNHMFTLQWFSQYLRLNPDSILVFVGDGKLRDRILSRVHDCNLEEKVVFTGVRSDVNELIHVFDVVFFPSVFEGLGGVAIEAQAAGVPCVESDTIPLETDLGLGLIRRCSLSDSLKLWSEQVDCCRTMVIPSATTIYERFKEAGYTIEATTEKYCGIYQGKKHSIDEKELRE